MDNINNGLSFIKYFKTDTRPEQTMEYVMGAKSLDDYFEFFKSSVFRFDFAFLVEGKVGRTCEKY